MGGSIAPGATALALGDLGLGAVLRGLVVDVALQLVRPVLLVDPAGGGIVGVAVARARRAWPRIGRVAVSQVVGHLARTPERTSSKARPSATVTRFDFGAVAR